LGNSLKGVERFLKALNREEPDRVPIWELIIDRPVIKSLYGDISYADVVEILDLDGITAGEDVKMREIEKGKFVCEWGITWGTTEFGVVYPLKGPIKSKKDLIDYQPPDPDADYRLNTLEEYIDRFKGEKAIVLLSHDAFEFSHYLVGGMANLFRLYYKDPEAAHILAEKIVEYKSRVVERAIKAGADVILSGDDYADKNGPLVSPRMFKIFIMPYLKRVVDTAKRYGKPFIKHTDGKIWKILDMIVATGIDGLHPIEPCAGMDILKVKRMYGDRICVIGNIDCSYVLPLMSPNDVEEVVKETIAKVAPGGGYILSSSNSIHPGVKPENFLVMIKAAKRYGRYPISEELIREYGKRNFYSKIFKF